ncbi:hypothetical protein KAJ27_08780 [bacterium]|nr:hypothetical protein [bacterium]
MKKSSCEVNQYKAEDVKKSSLIIELIYKINFRDPRKWANYYLCNGMKELAQQMDVLVHYVLSIDRTERADYGKNYLFPGRDNNYFASDETVEKFLSKIKNRVEKHDLKNTDQDKIIIKALLENYVPCDSIEVFYIDEIFKQKKWKILMNRLSGNDDYSRLSFNTGNDAKIIANAINYMNLHNDR